MKFTLQFAALLMGLAACNSTGARGSNLPTMESFGTTQDGTAVHLYTLTNTNGMVAKLTDFGATLVELHVPDRDGALADVVLGFDDVSGYEGDGNQYFGCIAGRVANRVAKGRFTLDGASYQLATNNDPNHLHGGTKGFGQRVWRTARLAEQEASGVRFSYVSPAGEEGYPGTLDCEVTYWLTDDDELVLEYRATCDAATPVNLTHHSYFNLAGHGAATILDHELVIDAANHTPTDDTLIPTGLLEPVAGTPLDFTSRWVIGDRVAQLDDTPALGYDHNFVIDAPRLELTEIHLGVPEGRWTRMSRACRLSHAGSGRVLEIWTDEPGLQFYTGNFLFGQEGKGGATYAHRSGLCLETQHFPDSINQPSFPSTVLRPGETYTHRTVHRFTTE